MFVACTINYSLWLLLLFYLFVCVTAWVREFSFENVHEDVSWNTIHHESRIYLHELFLYWLIEIIVKDKTLTQWLKKLHLFLQEKNIKKEKKEKRIKELICATINHHADFWTQKVIIQLTESGADYCQSSGCFNCQTWSVGSEFCLNFIFIFLFFLECW